MRASLNAQAALCRLRLPIASKPAPDAGLLRNRGARGCRQVLAPAPVFTAEAAEHLNDFLRIRPSPVYPRWRGEYSITLSLMTLCNGLSPLTQGTLFLYDKTGAITRFIPAGAGNTTGDGSIEALWTVYPRWRGEHSLIWRSACRYSGLSPLARGTPDVFVFDFHCSRFIPAGAGNTFLPQITSRRFSVYPRWRGEHAATTSGTYFAPGLSPLARGTLQIRYGIVFRSRFIPAGAGNTMQGNAK